MKLKKALAALETVEYDDLQRSKEICAFHLKLDHQSFIKQLADYKEYTKGH